MMLYLSWQRNKCRLLQSIRILRPTWHATRENLLPVLIRKHKKLSTIAFVLIISNVHMDVAAPSAPTIQRKVRAVFARTAKTFMKVKVRGQKVVTSNPQTSIANFILTGLAMLPFRGVLFSPRVATTRKISPSTHPLLHCI